MRKVREEAPEENKYVMKGWVSGTNSFQRGTSVVMEGKTDERELVGQSTRQTRRDEVE